MAYNLTRAVGRELGLRVTGIPMVADSHPVHKLKGRHQSL